MTVLVNDKFFSDATSQRLPLSLDNTIHRVFEEQVRRTPDNIAIICDDETLTYDELNRRANQLARYICGQHKSHTGTPLEPETLIAIFLDRSVDMVVAILGVLKAGGSYVPIDTKLPLDRIRYLISDTKCPIVVTQKHLLNQFQGAMRLATSLNGRAPGSGAHPIVLDLDPCRGEDGKNLAVKVTGTDLAYVIYTSGTTGVPKGVMIEHRSVVNLAGSRRADFGITERSAVLQLSPIAFDASVCEIFSALTLGARLVIATEDARRDPNTLLALLRFESITVATILPSLLTQLSQSGVPDLPELTTLVVAGEPCTDNVMRTWSSGRRLIHAYGPTEATVCATVHRFRPGDPPSTIGRAIRNMRVYLLDEKLNQVPTGAVGELCVMGVGLARGYLNLPGQTTESFIENPFSTPMDRELGYGTLYRTGDLARRFQDGTLEYVSRNDFQVKIRGYRIELGEIESVLLSYPEIKQVCVVAHVQHSGDTKRNESGSLGSPGEKILVVYYVADQEIDSSEIVRYLQRSLPDYMIPRRFVHMAEFPVTDNGKIDRRRLPAPRFAPTSGYVPPRTGRERDLLAVWQSVLGIDSVGVEDDFFEIGGDSLSVATLAAKISENFGCTLYVSTIYSHRTVAAQAELLNCDAVVERRPISAFRAQGTRPPLFFVHPSMTGTKLYKRMVRWLDPDQPFYGIESYNRDHMDTPETDLRALARRYFECIREIQPKGPYFLGGYSAGGNIAYEIAHQLLDIGEIVSGLYLIDSVVLTKVARGRLIRARDAEEFLDYFRIGSGADESLLRLAEAEMSLLFGYEPGGKLDANVVLIKAKHLLSPMEHLRNDHIARYLFRRDSPCSGWEGLARDVDCHEISANHTSIMNSEHLECATRIIQTHINTHSTREISGPTAVYWSSPATP